MSRRGLTWTAAGIVGLALLVLGAPLAWERHRYRLWTPQGAIHIGMTHKEVEAVLGPPVPEFDGNPGVPQDHEYRIVGGCLAEVVYDKAGFLSGAALADGNWSHIPRPPLVEHIRSWFTGKREE